MDKKKLAIIGGIIGAILLFIVIGVAVTFNNDEVVEKEKEKEVASNKEYTVDDYKELGLDGFGEADKKQAEMDSMPSPELEDVPNAEELEKQKEKLEDIVIEDKKNVTGEKTGEKITIKAKEGSTVKKNEDGSTSIKTDDIVIKKPAEIELPKESEKVDKVKPVVEVPKTVIKNQDEKELIENSNHLTEIIKGAVPSNATVLSSEKDLVVVKDGSDVLFLIREVSDAQMAESNGANYKMLYNNMFNINPGTVENGKHNDTIYNSLRALGVTLGKDEVISSINKVYNSGENFKVGKYEFRKMNTGTIYVNWDN